MGSYSIKEIEHLTGIKAHTLRIWEQRYKIIRPKRTETNIRYYSDDDLKLVLNITLLNKHGHRIGTISKMSFNEIEAKVGNLEHTEARFELHINNLTTSMIEMNEEKFEKIMATNILQNGFETTMRKIVYPFLERIGIMWITNNINPAQEHFISNLIRQKIIVAIDGQIVKEDSDTLHFVLYLPEGEQHELGLLFLCYLLKTRNHKVTYLGCNVPVNDLISVIKLRKPDYIYSIFTTFPSKNQVVQYIENLSEVLPETTTLLISGRRALLKREQFKDNIVVFEKTEDIFDFIDKGVLPDII